MSIKRMLKNLMRVKWISLLFLMKLEHFFFVCLHSKNASMRKLLICSTTFLSMKKDKSCGITFLIIILNVGWKIDFFSILRCCYCFCIDQISMIWFSNLRACLMIIFVCGVYVKTGFINTESKCSMIPSSRLSCVFMFNHLCHFLSYFFCMMYNVLKLVFIRDSEQERFFRKNQRKKNEESLEIEEELLIKWIAKNCTIHFTM